LSKLNGGFREGGPALWLQYPLPRIADRYSKGLKDLVQTPVVIPGAGKAIQPVRLAGVYKSYPQAPDGLTILEMMASRVLSLPMDPYLDPATQARIIEAVRDAVGC
jgi:UDP-2-acetamido-2-deoxy-ribo-hexuluronate aminotransferase